MAWTRRHGSARVVLLGMMIIVAAVLVGLNAGRRGPARPVAVAPAERSVRRPVVEVPVEPLSSEVAPSPAVEPTPVAEPTPAIEPAPAATQHAAPSDPAPTPEAPAPTPAALETAPIDPAPVPAEPAPMPAAVTPMPEPAKPTEPTPMPVAGTEVVPVDPAPMPTPTPTEAATPEAKPAETATPAPVPADVRPRVCVEPMKPATETPAPMTAPEPQPAAPMPAAAVPAAPAPAVPMPEAPAAPMDGAKPAETAPMPAPPAAEGGTPAGPLPGHSVHGEIFDEGPRQRAVLMGGTGPVNFPITTKSPEAQAFFNQGVGQLHGFWYYEAERSFRQAAMLDPDAPMPYLGMALANERNKKRATGFFEQAKKRRDAASRREQLWIDALGKLFEAGDRSGKDRRKDLVAGLEGLLFEFPDDLEAKAFLCYFLWTNGQSDLPNPSNLAVNALISEVLAVEPMHPVHHYRIHLWDYAKPERALQSSALGGPSSPRIAHMWHMPGHIYSRLQRYGDACYQQEASARVDHAYMMADRVLPDQIHNFAHNEEWFVRNLIHVGRYRDALTVSKNLIEMPRHPKYNTLGRGGTSQYGRARLFETLTRFELWGELERLVDEATYLEPTDDAVEQVKRLRHLGIARIGLGKRDEALDLLCDLEQRRADLTDEQHSAGEKAESEARAANKNDDEVKKARERATGAFTGRISVLSQAIKELHARLAGAEGRHALAAELLDKASGVDRETIALMHLAAGDAAKAEDLARKSVDDNRGQVLPLATLAWIQHKQGKTAETLETLTKLRAISERIDLDAPAFVRLRPAIEAAGWPADWRQAAAPTGDRGPRPPLDSLGPLEWRPSPAATWELVDAQGVRGSLEQYRGRPVVVLHYLGFGCLHCVEQLKQFAPEVEAFRAAGIEVIAVSNESQEDLARSLEAGKLETTFPIRLFSDESMNTFRAARAFDDFESQPLHATLLIDGAGFVRWQDIGPEPFTDVKFLLDESRRLLRFEP